MSLKDVSVSDVDEICRTDVFTVIPEHIVARFVTKPPFVTVPGLFNLRDVANPLAEPYIRRNFIFRSAMLGFIADEGKTQLGSELGIKTIFDLRTAPERVKTPSPEIPGVDTRWVPLAQEAAAIDFRDFPGDDNGVKGMVKMYEDILKTHVPNYRAVFEHIRDFPDRPILFHCTGTYRKSLLS